MSCTKPYPCISDNTKLPLSSLVYKVLETTYLALSKCPFPKFLPGLSMKTKPWNVREARCTCFMHQSDSLKKLTSLYLSVQKLFLTIPVWYQILPLPPSSLIFLDSHIYSNSKNINLNVSVWPPCSPGYLRWALINACYKASDCSEHPTNVLLHSSSCLLPQSSPENPARKSYISKFISSIQKSS